MHRADINQLIAREINRGEHNPNNGAILVWRDAKGSHSYTHECDGTRRGGEYQYVGKIEARYIAMDYENGCIIDAEDVDAHIGGDV